MGTRTSVALLLAVAVATAGEVEVRGKVVDAEGNPVAGIEVAKSWVALRGGMHATKRATTDAEGKFALKTEFEDRLFGLLAFDKERKRGATVVVGEQTIAEGCELTLEPTAVVKGAVACAELGSPPPSTNVAVLLLPGDVLVALARSSDARFSLILPVGDYKFHVYGEDVVDHEDGRFVEGTEGEIDLGTIELRATRLAKLYGKPPPPWKVTDARGASKDVSPATFKGKWLLLEFWGFW